MNNRKRINTFIKDLNDIELVLLMERLVNIMEQTKEDIEANPADWERSIIHPRLWMGLIDKVNNHFNNQ